MTSMAKLHFGRHTALASTGIASPHLPLATLASLYTPHSATSTFFELVHIPHADFSTKRSLTMEDFHHDPRHAFYAIEIWDEWAEYVDQRDRELLLHELCDLAQVLETILYEYD
jgi:hypothetical protein